MSGGQHSLGAWYVNVGHDANGYLGDQTWGATIDSNNSYVGDGTCYTAESTYRIPKNPLAAGVPTFSEILPTSVRVSFTGCPDDMGSAVDTYLLRRRDASPADGPGYVDDQQNNASRVITGLTPGKTYYWCTYAHNGVGYSPKSADRSVTLPAGVWESNGSTWAPTTMMESDGSSWAVLIPQESNGTSWANPALTQP
jgi:hypothetical protein